MNKNRFFLIFGVLLTSIYNVKAEAAVVDFLRSTGKIYSVIAVIVVILIGIGVYLYKIDNKLTKLENQINNEQ